MQRVMIVGQPGSGKSTLARALGEVTNLPVVHMDNIHWMSGWVERSPRDKDILCSEVHERPEWIFEGGRSMTWSQRLARADTLIWLDVPVGLRMTRVIRRTLRYWGRNRPDLPDGCPEHFNRAFLQYIWRTRDSQRELMRKLFEGAPADKTKLRLTSASEVKAYLRTLGSVEASRPAKLRQGIGSYSAG